MKIIISAMAAVLLLAGCGNKVKQSGLSDSKPTASVNSELSEVQYESDTAAIPVPPADNPQKKTDPLKEKASPNADWDKKIIKTASLNMEVKDYKAFYNGLKESIRSLGGYLAQEEQTQSDYKIENSLVIKVPVDQFDMAISRFITGAEKINEKRITSQDVTAEYVDTRSRMEARKQVRLRYIELLKQAKNMDEILTVQSEIDEIQEEIESATGRVDYLRHASSFSTINLTYYQVLNATARETTEPSFGKRIAAAFKTGMGWIGDIFVGLILIWPLLLLIFVLVIVYKKITPVKARQI